MGNIQHDGGRNGATFNMNEVVKKDAGTTTHLHTVTSMILRFKEDPRPMVYGIRDRNTRHLEPNDIYPPTLAPTAKLALT
jgi:hypothetical protein